MRHIQIGTDDVDVAVCADPALPQIVIIVQTAKGMACVEEYLVALMPLQWDDCGGGRYMTKLGISEDAEHPKQGQAAGLAVNFRAMGCTSQRLIAGGQK